MALKWCGRCRPFEVPALQAANTAQELQMESGTGIISLLAPMTFRSSRKVCAEAQRELRKVGTGFHAFALQKPLRRIGA
jgi:hypothetical protein